MIRTQAQAEQHCHTLGRTDAMPGYCYGIPAVECNVGSRLVTVPGSTCHNCYALQGRYMFENVQTAEYKRFRLLSDPLWVDAMVFLISKKCVGKNSYFRWHDSGDLQSIDHLENICTVAKKTPNVHHWLPTREYRIYFQYLKTNALPTNLVARLSGHMIDRPRPNFGPTVPTSTVVTDGSETCPKLSPENQGNCQKCRSCWNPNIQNVSYKYHGKKLQ